MTLKEWDDAAAELSKDEAKKILDAIEVLENWPVMKKAFGWTGLFALTHTLRYRVEVDRMKTTAETISKVLNGRSTFYSCDAADGGKIVRVSHGATDFFFRQMASDLSWRLSSTSTFGVSALRMYGEGCDEDGFILESEADIQILETA